MSLFLLEHMVTKFPEPAFTTAVRSAKFQNIWQDMFSFATRKASVNGTFALWLNYIEMVQTLMLFLRATRENNWRLHLSAVRSMLPWFFAMDRVNYARYGTVYWLEMSCMDETNPGIKDNLFSQ